MPVTDAKKIKAAIEQHVKDGKYVKMVAKTKFEHPFKVYVEAEDDFAYVTRTLTKGQEFACSKKVAEKLSGLGYAAQV